MGILTRNGNSNLAKGISEAWSTLQTNATEIPEKLQEGPKIVMLKNEVMNAGFAPENKIPNYSVTKALTIETETLRHDLLLQNISETASGAEINNNIKPREKDAFMQVCDLGNQFLTALPDVTWIQTDKVILESTHTYL